MHITCCASAYQLICKRTTAVVRPEILTNSKTYTIFSNKKTQTYNTFATNLQQKTIRIGKNSKNQQIYNLHISIDYQVVSILTVFALRFVV